MSTPLSDESSSSSATAAELRIRPCDDQDEDDVEVLLIESDDGEGTQTGTAIDDVEVIDVDSDSDVILVDSGGEVEVDKKKRPALLEHRHLFECPSCDFVTDSRPLAVQHTQRRVCNEKKALNDKKLQPLRKRSKVLFIPQRLRSLTSGSAAASEPSSAAGTAVSTDQDSRAWRLHDPVVGNLKRLYDGNSNNLRSARDKLTRALKRQVTAPAWKLIRDLNVDPIEEKDDGADGGDDEDRAFNCTECDFRSDCRRRFLSHYELSHVSPENFGCEFCPFKSSVVEERNRHLEAKHFACSECDHCAGHYVGIMRHVANHSRKRPSSETAASRHATPNSISNNNVGDLACSHCDYRAEHLTFLQRHVKARHTDKNFMCKLCNFRSARRWCVKQHIVGVHKKLRLYLCPHCQHRAGSRGNLNVHVRAVHLKDRKTLNRRARYSAKYTANKKSSMQSRQQQRQPGAFACNFCGYVTSIECDLYRHIKDEHPVLNVAEAAAPAPAAAVQKNILTEEGVDDLMPPNVVTLDEAGLRSGKISIVYE